MWAPSFTASTSAAPRSLKLVRVGLDKVDGAVRTARGDHVDVEIFLQAPAHIARGIVFLLALLIVLGEVCGAGRIPRGRFSDRSRCWGCHRRPRLRRSVPRLWSPASCTPPGSRQGADPALGPAGFICGAMSVRTRAKHLAVPGPSSGQTCRTFAPQIVGDAQRSVLEQWTVRWFPACLKSRRYKRPLRAPQRAAPST